MSHPFDPASHSHYALSDAVVARAKLLGERIAGENGAKDCAAVIAALTGTQE